jgi:hypothetical protein
VPVTVAVPSQAENVSAAEIMDRFGFTQLPAAMVAAASVPEGDTHE